MILSDVRHYIKRRGQATLADIALHFDTQPDAVRGMLEVWIRKGNIYRKMATASCGNSCSQCDPAATEVYVWKGSDPGVAPQLPTRCEHSG